ncbi:MAG: hypothetical protein ACKER6_01260 [Candidatus Hodgkinia cicadicola]
MVTKLRRRSRLLVRRLMRHISLFVHHAPLSPSNSHELESMLTKLAKVAHLRPSRCSAIVRKFKLIAPPISGSAPAHRAV